MPLNAQLREKLIDLIPHGLVVTRSWLTGQDIGRHAIDNLVKSGQLFSMVHGVYARPGTIPTWRGLMQGLATLSPHRLESLKPVADIREAVHCRIRIAFPNVETAVCLSPRRSQCLFFHSSRSAPGSVSCLSLDGPRPFTLSHSKRSSADSVSEAVAGDTPANSASSLTPNHSPCRIKSAWSTCERLPLNRPRIDF
jgi:hypothetical protein